MALRTSDTWSRGKPNPRRPEIRKKASGKSKWYAYQRVGLCEGCRKRGKRQAHHALQQQYLEREAPERMWDLDNRVLIGVYCSCHAGHHLPGTNDTRLPRSKLRPETIAFISEILGEAAEGYLSRHYRND